VREAVDDFLAKRMTNEALWRERFDARLDRGRSHSSTDISPDEVDVSAARDDDPILSEIVRRLAGALKPEQIYLFGSKARGDAGFDSDYDLMVILPHTGEPGYRLAQKAHALISDLGAAADILVWSREAFNRRLHLRASLPATIVREGTILYAT
jgi:uncharacterized protein